MSPADRFITDNDPLTRRELVRLSLYCAFLTSSPEKTADELIVLTDEETARYCANYYPDPSLKPLAQL